MRRRLEKIYSPAIERDMDVLAYGHYGLPVLAFPSGGGQFHDFEDNGMINALAWLIEEGKIKLYCPPSFDNESWLNSGADVYWKGINHNKYQDFIVNNLVPAIRVDCQTPDIPIALTGCSLGGYHTANFALKFPQIFNYALCMSGRYDLETVVGGDYGNMDVYYNNPLAYVANLHGEALDQIRRHTFITLVCGQGAWEDKCLDETHRLADLLVGKEIPHERAIWGHDVEHHWHWWRIQIAHFFSLRFG